MTVWNVIDWTGATREIQAPTADKALEWAQEQYAAHCDDNSTGDNSDEVILVEIDFDDDANEIVIREKSATVEFEDTPSDYDQHNTNW